MLNAVIYCRVSTEEQTQENHHSLETQERLCQEYATRENITVIKSFVDAGKSGTTIKGRPALREMMNFIEDEHVDYILVQDTDRIARNTLEHLSLKALFAKNKTRLIAISQLGIDDTPEGKIMDTMLAGFNQFQSDITSRKTKKGLEQRAINGWLPTNAPPGYNNIVDENGKNVIGVDAERAPFIKMAFELYIQGNYGTEAIGNILYDKGFRTKRGKRLANSKLHCVLENPMYYGEFRWCGQIHKGKHKPIITKSMWDMAQTIRESRTLNRNYERKHSFLLSGFVVCQCGRKFTAEHHFKSGNRQYSYYHCTRGRACESSCNIRTHLLEQQVEQYFKKVTFDDEFFEKLLARLKHYHDSYTTEAKKQVQDLNRIKTEFEKKRDKIEELLVEEKILPDVYKRKAEEYQIGIANIEGEIRQLQQGQKISIKPLEEVATFARNAFTTYQAGSYDLKHRYLGFFWERFTVKGDKIVEAIATPVFRALQELQKPTRPKAVLAQPNPTPAFYKHLVRSPNKDLTHLAELGQEWSNVLQYVVPKNEKQSI